MPVIEESRLPVEKKRDRPISLRRPFFFLLAAPLFLGSCLSNFSTTSLKAQELPWVEARLGDHPLRLMIARTDFEKRKGLMFRRKLDESEGMLFVYDAPEPLSFWMKNTFLALDLVFFSPGLEVSEIVLGLKPARGIPDARLPGYESHGEAQYALELLSGTVKKWGIGLGDKLELPSSILNAK
ncbi:MAG TPA: hypothetical protein DD435_08910 [Cyanobacteria bacterium UBA8530]|nr:hypothetical protein [Cyanobacteria bacterium UBA8530]